MDDRPHKWNFVYCTMDFNAMQGQFISHISYAREFNVLNEGRETKSEFSSKRFTTFKSLNWH